MSTVGDKLTDGNGVNWVVARKWEWSEWNDLELINTATGAHGSLREMK